MFGERRPQGSPPIIRSSPASTMNGTGLGSHSVVIVEAGVDDAEGLTVSHNFRGEEVLE